MPRKETPYSAVESYSKVISLSNEVFMTSFHIFRDDDITRKKGYEVTYYVSTYSILKYEIQRLIN